MPSNHGKLKEDEMLLALNNHKIKTLLPNLRYLLEELFGALDPEGVVTCTQPDLPIKPDLLITYNGETKGLSMKSGTSEYIHGEPVEKFVEFLKEIGISKETTDTILLNQFGDGTLDGSGKERMNLVELKYRLRVRIKEANTELNSNPETLMKIIDRLVFKGWNENEPQADAIYHGDIYEGVITSKIQVMKHIKNKYWDYYDNLHVGPIFLRPHARYIGTTIKSEFYRHKIDGFWTNLLADMKYIAQKYFTYTPLNKRKNHEKLMESSFGNMEG